MTFLDKFSSQRNFGKNNDYVKSILSDKEFFAFYDDSKVVLYNGNSQFVTWIKIDDFEKLLENGWLKLSKNWI